MTLAHSVYLLLLLISFENVKYFVPQVINKLTIRESMADF